MNWLGQVSLGSHFGRLDKVERRLGVFLLDILFFFLDLYKKIQDDCNFEPLEFL